MNSTETLVQRACALAARAHQNQFRPDGVTPFVSHPVRVCLLVATEFEKPEPELMAVALLHDVIEKTELTDDLLACEFGPDIATKVSALSRPPDQDEDAYWARLYASDWRTRLIKIADVCDNLEDGRGSHEDRMEKARRALALTDGDEPAINRARAYLNALLTRHEQPLVC